MTGEQDELRDALSLIRAVLGVDSEGIRVLVTHSDPDMLLVYVAQVAGWALGRIDDRSALQQIDVAFAALAGGDL